MNEQTRDLSSQVRRLAEDVEYRPAPTDDHLFSIPTARKLRVLGATALLVGMGVAAYLNTSTSEDTQAPVATEQTHHQAEPPASGTRPEYAAPPAYEAYTDE